MTRFTLLLALLISLVAMPQALAKGSPGAPGFGISGPTSFGSVLPNQTAQITLTMTSSGGISAPAVTAGGPFALVSTSCTGASHSCTAIVSFTPPAGGDYTTQFTALVNNYYRHIITLTGHGYGASYAWVTPVYVYGVQSGTRGSIQMVLNSTGDTGLTVSSFDFGPGSANMTLGQTTCIGPVIASGSSCTVDIDYDFAEVDGGIWIDSTISANTNSGTTGYGELYISVSGGSDDTSRN